MTHEHTEAPCPKDNFKNLEVGDIIHVNGITDEFFLVASPLKERKNNILTRISNLFGETPDAEIDIIACDQEGNFGHDSSLSCLRITFGKTTIDKAGHRPDVLNEIAELKQRLNSTARADPLMGPI